jgi:hypothetical protein
MSDIPEPNDKMRLLMAAIADNVDYWVQIGFDGLHGNVDETAPESEKRAYQILRGSVRSDEEVAAFAAVVRHICMGVLDTFFLNLDEGFPSSECPDEVQYFDIVDKETGESIFTWSAHEEYLLALPDGFVPPFGYADES